MFHVSFFNVIEEREVFNVKGHFGPVNSFDIHPTGLSYASGAEDGTIRVQELDPEYRTVDFD
jgi:WD40 repeat protein